MNSVFIKLTGNEDRHIISDEFEFRSYLTSHFGDMCPWTVKKMMSPALIGSLSNLQVTRTGIKARMSSNLGRIGLFMLELFALELRNFFPEIYKENDVSTFSQLPWIQSPSNLQVTRTGMKCWTGSNSGRIWPFTLELHALERWKKWCL